MRWYANVISAVLVLVAVRLGIEYYFLWGATPKDLAMFAVVVNSLSVMVLKKRDAIKDAQQAAAISFLLGGILGAAYSLWVLFDRTRPTALLIAAAFLLFVAITLIRIALISRLSPPVTPDRADLKHLKEKTIAALSDERVRAVLLGTPLPSITPSQRDKPTRAPLQTSSDDASAPR